MMRWLSVTFCFVVCCALVGCDRKSEPVQKDRPAASAPAAAKDEHAHKEGDGHDHAADDGHGHQEESGHDKHGGEVVELGSAKIGAFEVRASRDKGDLKPGGDAAVDLWIDGGVGQGVSTVRFWIGTEDAKGSIKAKADIEDGKWHTHTEIPDPLPNGSRLWVEIEQAGGKKAVGSFELK